MPPDDSLLIHAAADYDPAKAREYYLRTRELKGRKPGVRPTMGSRPTAGMPVRPAVKPKVSAGTVTQQKQKAIDARVAALTVKLDQLKENLKALVAAAKARSGVVTPVKKTSTEKAVADARAKARADKPLTPKQKKEAAERAQKAYDKSKPVSADKQAVELEKEIAEVQKKIAKAKADISKAIAKAREKTAAKPSAKTAGFQSR